MKHISYFAAALAALGCAYVQTARAQTTRIEAETELSAGDTKVVEDANASGGKAVSIARGWQPLIKAKVPAGEAFTVWVRARGSVLAKGTPEGKQKDLKWLYGKTDWAWKSAGRFTREQLGESVVVIRGGGEGEGPLLDAIEFATDNDYVPAEISSATAAPKAATSPANTSATAGESAPAGVLVEAETTLAAGDIKVVENASASGGKAVSIARDWQPLLKAAIPAGDAFTVWVRHAGGTVIVKSSEGGKQKDLKTLSTKSDALTWRSAGRHSRADLGDTLFVIRTGGGGQGALLDAVVFAADENAKPGAAGTVAAAAPAKSTVEIDRTPSDAQKQANLNEGAALALGIINRPKGELVEAETNKPGGTNEIVQIAGASGGKAVTSGNDYQMVFQAPVPAQGEAWRVFVRHRGGPFALKVKQDGKTTDRWFFRKPTDWTWTETDVFSREELGKDLRIGRGSADKKPDVMIDAVVFAPDVKRALPANRPDAALPAQKVSASIDWAKSAGTVSPLLWGINEHVVTRPKEAADGEYPKLLGALHSPFIRIHHADLTDDWTDAKTRDWDVAKIKAGMAASSGFGDAKIMLCFDEWPAWLSKSATLEPEKHAEFAALCARLVKIMRDDVKRPIDYWEITNERDNNYEKAGKLPELFALYNAAAAAMRREDPNIKLGGLAFTWAKRAWLDGFLQACDDVQFLSWHNYGTGDLYEPNAKLFAGVNSNIGGLAKGALESIQKYGKGRKLETFLTETNVKYTWDPYERRHQNVVGAVFHAATVLKMADLGVSGINLWQERGSAYGSLIDNKNKTFPSYYLYGWGPKFLSGARATSSSGDEKLLEILPITREDGTRSVLLLNKTDHALTLPAASSLLPNARAERIDADGFKAQVETDGELSLPGYSLTLLTTAK